MKLSIFILAISSIISLPACQSAGGGSSSLAVVSPLMQHSAYPSSPVSRQGFPGVTGSRVDIEGAAGQASTELWERIRSELSWQVPNNKQVDQAVNNYLAQSGYLPVVSQRGSLYLYYIVEEVQKRNMPMEIALVPLVESTLNPFAYSSSRAAGLWQIMPKTGEDLGLQQTWWFDGRRAVCDSTQAALDYLEELHTEFDNDWLLALAAYNAGKGRVARARRDNIKKGLPTDFWSLKLPRETRRYVPKVLALSRILAEPEAHAVEIPSIANEPAFEIAEIGGQIELAKAAELADVSLETLRGLNPGQLRWATDPEGPQELLVPFGTGGRFEEELARLGPTERVRWRHYTIQWGDNLIGIAKKFHTDVALLRQVNGITGSNIRAGKSLIIPGSDRISGLAITENPLTQAIGYKVRRGDSLTRIAGKYKVSIADIVAWNTLDMGKYLQPGQTLKLHVNGS